jgi:transposase InsO family protein
MWQMPINGDESRVLYDLYAIDKNDSSESTQMSDLKQYESLDQAIDEKYAQSKDMCSLSSIIRGHSPTSENKKRKRDDLRPVVFVRLNTRKGKPKPVTIKALLDSGGSESMIKAEYVKKLKLRKRSTKSSWMTPAGILKTDASCKAQFIIPELHDNRLIEWDFHVTQNMGAYDMIIGRDMLDDLGINIQFSDRTIHWDGIDMPFKDVSELKDEVFHVEEPEAVQESMDRVRKILDNDYAQANLEEVCRQQPINEEQQKRLLNLMLKYESLFDGTLGAWTHPDHRLELKEGVKPYHAKSFPVPKVHLETLKKEVYRLCDVGVLKRVNRSEWAAPTFIIPKKDGKVRFVSDFRELNKRIRRTPYPMPHIQDMLLNLEGFQYATALDLNMGYYHVRLDPDSRKLCTIILPFGKFEYQRLPQGISVGPDIFQEKMNELFDGMDYIRAYIDDILVLTKGDFDDHLEKLDATFHKLQTAGLKVNAPKSFFFREEIEYLGYIITRNGIKPQTKKIEAIQRIASPKNKKELRSFIGVVNYYRDMWVRRSHLLAPLAALTSKKAKWKWTEEHENAFRKMKAVISREVMLAYPDFSKPFEIHTDASHTQLGAVISQDGKPIAFYSRKLNPAQTRYTTTERELLSIVETLKEYRNILLGHEIIVYTDHKNLVYKHFNTERVMRWRLIIEEFGPELRYIKGSRNVVADALSRLDMMSYDQFQQEYSAVNLAESFANDAEDFPADYPLSYAQLEYEQNKDNSLLDQYANNDKLERKVFTHSSKEYNLIVRNGKIVIPATLQDKTVEYYHQLLMHPGETRTELTISQHYYWKNMRQTCHRICSKCTTCQRTKPKLKKYGQVSEKNPDVIPWKTVCIDLIGPYEFGHGKHKARLHCLTAIDPATGWFEIASIPNKRADEVANIFEMLWLTKYPWPQEVIMDRGKEFMGEVKDMLKNVYGITRRPITTRNPQANAMVERAHQTLHNMIRSQRIRDARDLTNGSWDGVLAAVGFAMRSTVHTTLQATPAQLVFGRDALLNVNFEADWQYIKARKQHIIRQNLQRENKKRVAHQYSVGDRVLVEQDPHRKHGEDRYTGPYVVTRINDNGTVTLNQGTNHGGVVAQTWNVRQLTPYRD